MNTRVISFATQTLQSHEGLRRQLESSDLFVQLQNTLRKIDIDGETYYVAEGDTLLDSDQLAFYAHSRQRQDEAYQAARATSEAGLGVAPLVASNIRGLLGIVQNGKVVRWAPNFVLSYRVARETFTSEDRYRQAAQSIAPATAAWEDTCGIKFQYRDDLDTQPGSGPAGAVFSVREFNAGGSFIAASFFPNDPPARRRVLIDPSFFQQDLGFDRVGVLRHELGHVLGFRHEHIRSGAPPVCPGEALYGVIELTEYDPRSVMHYFCGNRGTRDLKITDLDREGAQRVYGPPLTQTEYVAA